ncbi:CalY family protein [Aeromicrobium wangtongii]|uniref:CalY family protein n=1 Tax=Aeromicrobium wangtongii TaxID=2969247 RepID=UPI002016C9B0|nr:CalY family protein [Aeromicrobium wangtongii]MCL3817554.1 CalY family protein [Aeromicrobium wangtongii]
MKLTKILLPLATLVAAGAIAVGSGATFTSTSANTISSVTAGTLSQSNSKANAAVFNLTNIKPGDVANGSLTITNTGSLPAKFSLTETASTNTFTGSNLTLVITNTTTNTVVYTGVFGGLPDGVAKDLGPVNPGVANNFTFSVRLDQATPNTDQGKTASAAFKWDSVQENGKTTSQ